MVSTFRVLLSHAFVPNVMVLAKSNLVIRNGILLGIIAVLVYFVTLLSGSCIDGCLDKWFARWWSSYRDLRVHPWAAK